MLSYSKILNKDDRPPWSQAAASPQFSSRSLSLRGCVSDIAPNETQRRVNMSTPTLLHGPVVHRLQVWRKVPCPSDDIHQEACPNGTTTREFSYVRIYALRTRHRRVQLVSGSHCPHRTLARRARNLQQCASSPLPPSCSYLPCAHPSVGTHLMRVRVSSYSLSIGHPYRCRHSVPLHSRVHNVWRTNAVCIQCRRGRLGLHNVDRRGDRSLADLRNGIHPKVPTNWLHSYVSSTHSTVL